MARVVLYGLSRDGAVLHSETLEDLDRARLIEEAEERLQSFHTIEIWVQSVRVIRLSQSPS